MSTICAIASSAPDSAVFLSIKNSPAAALPAAKLGNHILSALTLSLTKAAEKTARNRKKTAMRNPTKTAVRC